MMNFSPLLTDLYQLTMLQGYFDQAMEETAAFEFFVRKLPQGRNFLVAAGLEQVVDFLENLTFTPEDLYFLEQDGRFRPDFLEYLSTFRFTGDVHAMDEGTLFFQDEPIIRITAPLPQAQFVETRIINILQFQSMIASKAARHSLLAPDKLMVDFGLRRAHGAEAGLFAARASYLAGFSGTSTVLAGQLYGVPVFGTMAHSFIQAHDSEMLAFEHFAECQPENVVLLIDTYDTEKGAQKVVDLAPKLSRKGIVVKAVRLDSGDLATLSAKVRHILDQGGLQKVKIFISGNLDEYRLSNLCASGAPIDGFGVGTKMITSADAPHLDCAYKLVEFNGVARRKRSEGKATWPGPKQVYRRFDGQGQMCGDILTIDSDSCPGTPLIKPVMHKGQRISDFPLLQESRSLTLSALATLPEALKSISTRSHYSVEISTKLKDLALQVDRRRGEG